MNKWLNTVTGVNQGGFDYLARETVDLRKRTQKLTDQVITS